MKRNFFIYLGLLVFWGLIGCEFKIPTTPRLPSKWNTKVVIPLLYKTYSLSSLVFDSLAASSNPIMADTATGRLSYLVSDSSSEDITVLESFCTIASHELSKEIDLSNEIKINPDSTVIQINILAKKKINTTNNRVKFGLLNAAGSPDFNRIIVTANLSDTFFNDIQIKIICQNFKDNNTGTLRTDSLTLSINSTLATKNIIIDGDSLIGASTNGYIDSLVFAIDINIEDKLGEPLDSIYQSLTIDVDVLPLELESFNGEVNASGVIPTELFINSPPGAESINFNLATISFSITDNSGQFDRLLIEIVGKKQGEDNTEIDSLFFPFPDTCEMELGQIISNLPDSIIIYVIGMLEEGNYTPASSILLSEGLSVKYSIQVPFNFTLPTEMIIASGRPTSFVIKDSSVRANIIQVQQGAELETTVENRTPFQGNILLLLGNCQYFPFDSTETPYDENYKWNALGDSLFYNDTVHVVIDTLAVLEIPAATFSGDSLIEAGVLEDQISFADSAAVSHFADTLTHYIMPHFLFLNPDTSNTILRDNQSITIRSYLNLLLDPAALTHQGVDTSDTL
ncbi:MAG: hypothetical protein ISS81_00255 [Candidatus Marinimicrobia bacterium]|nr:hypothetical protein [Candidatus Neomarinimicrobiota bacterium]